jgi:hypothetical protein
MQKRVTNFDDFEKDVLRRTIFGFYDNGEFPTSKKLALKLRDKINYRGSVTSVYKILKSIGFTEKPMMDVNFLWKEETLWLFEFELSSVHNLRITGDERPVFYLDETWVNQNH